LTDLLGRAIQPKPNYHQPKEPGLPRCVENAEPNDDRTLPPELKPGNLKKLGTTGKQPKPQNMQSQAADNARYEPARKAKPNAKTEQPNPACRQKRQGRKHTSPDAIKAQARPKRAGDHEGGQGIPPLIKAKPCHRCVWATWNRRQY